MVMVELWPSPFPIHERFERQVSFLVLVKLFFKQSAEVDMFDLEAVTSQVRVIVIGSGVVG